MRYDFSAATTDWWSLQPIYEYFRLYEKMCLSDRAKVAPAQKPKQRVTQDSSDLAAERDSTALRLP
jgi:hypothetical protein